MAAAPADAAVTHLDAATGPQPKVTVQPATIRAKAVRVIHRKTRKSVTVVPGDTLWDIARTKCHNPADWTGIYAANQDTIGTNPNLILPGQHLAFACQRVLSAVRDAVQPAAAEAAAQPAPKGKHHKPEVAQATAHVSHHRASWGGYRNPFRHVSNLVWERTDAGVDFAGSGPVYALGDGVVTNTFNAGWPGGVFISYRLESGPLAGKYIYVAETITPSVTVGQHVTSSTVLGIMHEGGSGIETGFAEAPGTGNPLEHFAGSATSAGSEFRAILKKVISNPDRVVKPFQGDGKKKRHVRVRGVLSCKNLGHSPVMNTAHMWNYFTRHGLSRTGAAAVIGSIYGESGGNPESVGSGGGGLIGWTPLPGGLVTGNPGRDLAVQEAGVLHYIDTYGSRKNVNKGTVPQALANFVYNYERPADPAGQTVVRTPAALAVYADCAG